MRSYLCIIDFIRRSYLIGIVIALSLLSHANAQTYISPVLGYDFQKVVSDNIHFSDLNLKYKGYGNASPLFGLKIKQRIFNQMYLHYNGDFTHKHISGYSKGAASQDLLFHYNYFRSQFSLSYLIMNRIYVGAGTSFNIVSNFYYEDFEHSDFRSNPIKDVHENVWVYFLGLQLGKFDIQVFYYNRLNYPKKGNHNRYLDIHRMHTLGFRIAYDIKLFEAIMKSKNPDIQTDKKYAMLY